MHSCYYLLATVLGVGFLPKYGFNTIHNMGDSHVFHLLQPTVNHAAEPW